VLTEEALVFLGGLAALGCLALGVLELLWPTRPPPRVRAGTPAPAAAPPPTPEPVAMPLAAVPAAAVPPRPRRWRSSRPRHARHRPESPYRRRQREEVTPELRSAFEEEPVTAPSGVAIAPQAPSGSSASVFDPEARVASVVDRCFALYEQRAYTEAVTAAATAIEVGSAAGRDADVARLWSIVALAQQALGDRGAARAALEAAVDVAPAADRPTYGRQLATLATQAARELVGHAAAVRDPGSEEILGALRDALGWVEGGLEAAPGDTVLHELATDLERRLWPAYEKVVLTLVQRQQYPAARRLLREALDDPRFPTERAESFRELFSGTYGGEIGQLTAQAIRSMQDARETEALGALERAEHLLGTIRDEALPPKRREEVDRRLWWGYKKLGRRRVQAGDYEAAAEALLHALRFAGVGTDRQADTRTALVRALEGLVEQHALRIRERADAGDREGALVQVDRLWVRLRGALAEGLTESDLAGAFARAQRLVDEIGARP
jgi:tetratricopeptide (TPR) repeat protein